MAIASIQPQFGGDRFEMGAGKLRHGEFAPLLSTRASLELRRDQVDPSLFQLPGDGK